MNGALWILQDIVWGLGCATLLLITVLSVIVAVDVVITRAGK